VYLGSAIAVAMGLASGALAAQLARAFESLESDVGVVMKAVAAHPFGGSAQETLNLIDGPSVCCTGFVAGTQFFLFGVLAGGIPAAATGIVLAFWRKRTRARPWPAAWQTVFRACFIFQVSSFMLAAVLAWAITRVHEHGSVAFGAFLLVNALASAGALPAWRTLQAPVEPSVRVRVVP
jgi:hypothetical protein